MEYKKHKERHLRHWISFPFIWIMVIPIFILDFSMEIYHRVCFKLYGIPYVKRSEYIKLDRAKLKYLKWYDKINCSYCGYANGIMHYGTRIAGDTEAYWCGIKHKPSKNFREPIHQKDFLKYGDEKTFRKKYCKLKK